MHTFSGSGRKYHEADPDGCPVFDYAYIMNGIWYINFTLFWKMLRESKNYGQNKKN